MNGNLDSFKMKSEEIKGKTDKIESDYQNNIISKTQYIDMMNHITIEKEKMYRSFLLAAKSAIKEGLNIDFSSYRDAKGYSSSLTKIQTLTLKSRDELAYEINCIKSAFNNSNIANNKVAIAIQVLEEYYVGSN